LVKLELQIAKLGIIKQTERTVLFVLIVEHSIKHTKDY